MPRPLALILAAICLLAPAGAASANPIEDENAKAGYASWAYPVADRGTGAAIYAGTVTTIDGYPGQTSVAPGDQLQLHVSSAGNTPYRVEVFRLGWYGGAGARRLVCLPSCGGSRPGVQQPAPPAPDGNGEVRAGWPVTDTVDVGASWPSGYYIAQLVLTSGPSAGRSRWVPFIVRPPAGNRAAILVEVPTNTWTAYNRWGGKSLYDNKSVDGVRANRVSFDRPLGPDFDLFDHELQTVRFLEREGYDVVYASDADVDGTPGQLTNHRLVVVNGHDEYWTRGQRDAFEAARASGVNLAFIGANIAYWQVRYTNGGRTLIGYKSMADPIADPAAKTVQFRDLGRPECRLLGVQYDNSWKLDGVIRNYGVWPGATSHRWLAGTGITQASTFEDTVAYEWDFVTPGCAHPPLTRLFHWSDPDGVLADADAVTYRHNSGAQVFSTGSLHFNRGLDSWRGYRAPQGVSSPGLQGFMRRMLDELSSGRPANTPPTARISPDTVQVVTGATLSLDDLSVDPDGIITGRGWDTDDDGAFDDGADARATLSFGTPGTHRVRLRVTDDAGDSAVATALVTVTAPPPPPPPGPPAPVVSTRLPPLPGALRLPSRLMRAVTATTRDAASTCRKQRVRHRHRRLHTAMQGCVRR